MVERPTPPAYPDFGHEVDRRLKRAGLSNADAAKAIGVSPEMIRRYREGLVMPRDAKLERLAKLLGMPIAELRYGGKGPKLALLPLARLRGDELALLEEYRALPDYAKKVARARIVELLEEFAPPTPKNPFGKGGTQ